MQFGFAGCVADDAGRGTAVEEVRSAFGGETGFVAPQNADVAAHSQTGAEMLEFDVVATQSNFDGVSGFGFFERDLSIADRHHRGERV